MLCAGIGPLANEGEPFGARRREGLGVLEVVTVESDAPVDIEFVVPPPPTTVFS